jgi:hypothetical protein
VGVAPNTAARYMEIVKSFFSFAVANQWIVESPSLWESPYGQRRSWFRSLYEECLAKGMARLNRTPPRVNHLPGQMPRGIAGEEDNHASGIVRLIEFCHSRGTLHSRRICSVIQPVSVAPGSTALTVMPRGANSDARLRVKASIAPLVAT